MTDRLWTVACLVMLFLVVLVGTVVIGLFFQWSAITSKVTNVKEAAVVVLEVRAGAPSTAAGGSLRIASDVEPERQSLTRPDPRGVPVSTPRTLFLSFKDPTTINAPEPLPPQDRGIRAIITNAARAFGVSPEWMIRVATCESTLNPNAIGDHGLAVGLWQFHPATFMGLVRQGRFPYDVSDRADPVASSLVAAYAFAHGRASEWTCS